MKDSKLINTLRTFSEDEMNLFGKFIASPFHNNGKNCLPLFKQLQRCHPDFDNSMTNNEVLYKKLYPRGKYNKQVMWNLSSALEKMTKSFLGQLALRKNKFVNMELELSEFGGRKLLNNYSQTLTEMEKLLDANGIEYEYFDKKVHLENYKQDYYYLTDKVQFMGDSTLKSSEYHAISFLRMNVGRIRDLKILEEYHNYKFDTNITNEFAKNLDLKNIVEYANRKNYEYAFLIEIYYHSLMMLFEPQKTIHLDRFKELYELHYKKFSMSEQSNLMHWLINYCLYNHELDEKRFRRTVFELNDFRLREGLAFYPENQLPKAAYLQILITSLAVNETIWVENFIKKYTIKLLPDIRESMRCMAYAFLYFHTKEYEKVLMNLNKVEFIDVQDKINTRILSAKSYYELNELETLLNYIDSSQHFLINNPSISQIQGTYNFNFFKYLKKLILIRENKNRDELHILKIEINKIKEISNDKWLLEKLNELERMHK